MWSHQQQQKWMNRLLGNVNTRTQVVVFTGVPDDCHLTVGVLIRPRRAIRNSCSLTPAVIPLYSSAQWDKTVQLNTPTLVHTGTHRNTRKHRRQSAWMFAQHHNNASYWWAGMLHLGAKPPNWAAAFNQRFCLSVLELRHPDSMWEQQLGIVTLSPHEHFEDRCGQRTGGVTFAQERWRNFQTLI